MTFTITGEKALRAKFSALPTKIQKQISRKALRPGATAVSQALKAAVPTISDDEADAIRGRGGLSSKPGSGEPGLGAAMRRMIRVGIKRRSKTYTNSGTVMIAVGPQFDFKREPFQRSAGYFAQRIELGDDTRAAEPFLKPAAQAVAGQAMSQMLKKARELVYEEARRA